MEAKNSVLKIPIDSKNPNKNIVPVSTSINEDGELVIGGCAVSKLIQKESY